MTASATKGGDKMTPQSKPATLSNILADPTKPSTEEQTNFNQSESIPETTYSDGTSPKMGQKVSQKFGRPPRQTNPMLTPLAMDQLSNLDPTGMKYFDKRNLAWLGNESGHQACQ